MTGHNPITDRRSKLAYPKRHILTDKKGIPLSAVISSSASTHDIKLVTYVDNSTVIKKSPSYKTKTRKGGGRKLHLCLDKAYNSEQEEQELIKRGYVLHIPNKRKRDEKEKEEEVNVIIQHCSS